MEKAIQQIKGDGRITNAYIFAFILILLSYFASIYTNRQLVKQSRDVDHTNEIIIDIETLTSAVKDAENGARGYIITGGNIEFLAPYYGKRQIADSLAKKIKVRVQDNPGQVNRLEQLHSLVVNRLDLLAFGVKDFENGGKLMTDSMRALQPSALQLMKDIRNIAKTMQMEERRLLLARTERLKRSFTLIDIINFISLIIASFLIIFSFFTYRKEKKARQNAVKKIEEYQDELRHRVDELDQANKELVHMKSLEKFTATGRIARTMAHEVRNPLTNINLATSQLKAELKDNSEQTAFFFEMIERNSERINTLISNLLNATKFSELNYQVKSLHDLLDDSLTEANDRISLGNVSITKKYKSGICNVTADEEKLKIAFLNIIINAVEAMTGSDGPKHLTIETRAESGKCRILFTDSGPGIDEESLQKIFEPYFTSKSEGTGLGLTNSQNIILNHKGDITVSSKKGEGTVIMVTLDFA